MSRRIFQNETGPAYLVSKQNNLRHTKNMVICPAFDLLWGRIQSREWKKLFHLIQSNCKFRL